jgi:hypothetical protein
MSNLINASEATKLLGIKSNAYITAITEWLHILPHRRIGNVIVIDKAELKAFAEQYDIPYYDNNGSEPAEKISEEESHG